MIRYSCPQCKHALQARDSEAGIKVGCPSCGQRVQVPPAPSTNKTALGNVQGSNKTLLGESPIPTAKLVTVRSCPYCREEIQEDARKCKHCGEILDADLRASREDSRPSRRSRQSGAVVLRGGSVCPNCNSADLVPHQKVGVAGWVIMGVSLAFGFIMFLLGFFTCITFFLAPLGLLGLFGLMVQENYLKCPECFYEVPR